MKSILIAAIIGLAASCVWADEKLPAKVVRTLERMKSIQKGQSPQTVLEHLGLWGDKTVKDLDGDGSLGSFYQSYSLGAGDEWVLCIDFFEEPSSVQGKHGKQSVFMAKLQRGSITKLKKNLEQDWQIVYPYWKEGKMITEAEDKKQKPSNKRQDKTTADPPEVTK